MNVVMNEVENEVKNVVKNEVENKVKNVESTEFSRNQSSYLFYNNKYDALASLLNLYQKF